MTKTLTESNKYSCALLVLGDLGEPAKISLSSIGNIQADSVCAIADDIGRKWLISNSSKEIINRICLHSNSKIESILKSLEQNNEYVAFGNPRFFKLMILKWLLILDIFEKHNYHACIYTDLDVYWRKSAKPTYLKFMESEKISLIQNDSLIDGSREFFCPGIMFWKNDNRSLTAIKEIYEIQKSKIDAGESFPDDKALNLWIQIQTNRNLVDFLPSKLYVIGHRMMWLMLGIKKFSLKNTVAFHGNYSVGLKQKTELMKAARVSYYSPMRVYYFLLQLKRKFKRIK